MDAATKGRRSTDIQRVQSSVQLPCEDLARKLERIVLSTAERPTESAESSGQIGSSAVLQGETHADPTNPREDKVNPEDDTEDEEA